MRRLGTVIASGGLCLAAIAAPLVAPGVEQRITEARQRGYWVIQEGESLYRIGRYFAADESQTRAIAKELQEANPNALILGDPSRLVVGARLRLPERLVSKPSSPPAPVAAPVPPAPVPPSPAPIAAAPTATAPAPPVTGIAPAPAEPAVMRSPAVAAPTAIASSAVPYVDRLIGGAPEPEPEERGAPGREADTTPGLRTWAVEARAERRDSNAANSRADTTAIAFRHFRETERYGDFTLVGQAAQLDAQTPQPGKSKDIDVTLFHDQFALTSQYVASSALGVVRPTLPTWLSTSYRVTLAPSLLQGASTVIVGAGGDFRASVGELGRYAGFGIQQFVRTSGQVASASASQRLDRDWEVGAVAIGVRGAPAVPDHATGSFAVQRAFGEPGSNAKFQLASSDNGERAGWLDVMMREGRLLQRFGAYQVDPEFLFGEAVTVRDSRGAYWRGDYRAAGNFFGGGIEYVEDNLRRDPSRGGAETAGVFGNMVLRLDRSTQLGAGGSYRQENPRVPGGADRDVLQGNASITHSLPAGQSRLDWNATLTRPVGLAGERYQAFNWNHDWPRYGALSVSTLLGYSTERVSERDITRRTAGVTARGELGRSLRWDATFTFVDSEDPQQGGDRNYNSSVNLEWSPVADWFVNLVWYRNRIQPGPDNPLAPFIRDNTMQVNFRYEGSAGTPYPRTGDAAGRSGTGTVSGSVFFDENRDGARQGNERGAGGVIVILDERASTTTDTDGRFTFPLVPAGRHRVRIVIERLPLPWGLDDESPREAEVRVREDSRLEIGLVRIGP